MSFCYNSRCDTGRSSAQQGYERPCEEGGNPQ